MPRGARGGKLSEEPKQIRNRLRRKVGKLNKDLDLYMDKAYGKPMEEWDLEELARGRPRAKDGTFRGKNPEWVTPAVTREAKRRLLEHTTGRMAGHVDLAVDTIVKLLKDKSKDENGRPLVDSRTRLDAAKFVIENVMGKPKAVIELDGSDVVKDFLAAALVMDDGEPAHPVVDGQFYDNDEDEEDDDDGDA